MRISDWSSDVCSSDLASSIHPGPRRDPEADTRARATGDGPAAAPARGQMAHPARRVQQRSQCAPPVGRLQPRVSTLGRSEEHTSELQSLLRISYAVFCLKKKKKHKQIKNKHRQT